MLQKTTWMAYLIFGISVALSCNKEKGDPIQNGSYAYENITSDTILFQIHNSTYSGTINNNVLKPQESLILNYQGMPGVFPFTGNVNSKLNGDSVIITFKNGKCVTYTRSKISGIRDSEGVFNLTEYDNYTQDLVNQSIYTLIYSIDSVDYKRAKDCM